jgi:hypothetical protein
MFMEEVATVTPLIAFSSVAKAGIKVELASKLERVCEGSASTLNVMVAFKTTEPLPTMTCMSLGETELLNSSKSTFRLADSMPEIWLEESAA